MNNITRLLSNINKGDSHASAELLPLVYDELRKLAALRLSEQNPGQTLQPTALVHEAYLRLVGDTQETNWAGRDHFYAACAEAMRHILVDIARRRLTIKHGGGKRRVPLEEFHRVTESPEDLLDLDAALTHLAAEEPDKARLIQFRFFGGLTTAEAASVLGISVATAERWWAFGRAWLYRELTANRDGAE